MMESDRELLEDAARAAGLHDKLFFSSSPVICPQWKHKLGTWDPLINDGDALRLAADLRLQFEESGDHRFIARTPEWDGFWTVSRIRHRSDRDDLNVVRESHGSDRRAALRLAITRAAASIGRASPAVGGGET